ncbi:MAG: RHS domain-containing protein, partial [Nanoarchaeota archaeon]|nr:RHS domain-containing protein [Nanoarchaeota archaeon]
VEFYHSDHLGSPSVVTDESGGVVWSADYDTFGEAVNEKGDNDLKYNSKEEDKTGLLYYGARYYNPKTGRFITADTVKGDIVDSQSQNRYVYVKNNPLKYIDPTGNEVHPATLKDGAGVCRDKSYFLKFLLQDTFGIQNTRVGGNSNYKGVTPGREKDVFRTEKGLITLTTSTTTYSKEVFEFIYNLGMGAHWYQNQRLNEFENVPTKEQLQDFQLFNKEMARFSSNLFKDKSFNEMNANEQRTTLNKIITKVTDYIPSGAKTYNFERADEEPNALLKLISGKGIAPEDHSWNQLKLNDGSRVAIDITNYNYLLENEPQAKDVSIMGFK